MTLSATSPKPILLIATCKKYITVCQKTVDSLETLADLVEIVVISDTTVTFPPYVRHLRKDSDDGWNCMIHDYVQGCDPDRQILIWMDDLILIRLSDRALLEDAIAAHREEEMDYLSLYCPPWEQIERLISRGGRYLRIDTIVARYPVSCMASLYRASFLLDLLDPNESPWQFEKTAPEKLRALPDRRLFALKYTPVDIHNIAIKGKLVPWRTADYATGMTLPSMGRMDTLKYRAKAVLYSLRHLSWSKLYHFILK